MEKQHVLVHKNKGKWRVYKNGMYTEHDEVFLQDVSFIIIPELQKESRETQKRIPHAYASGIQINFEDTTEIDWKNFGYDVFTQDNFTLTDTNEPVFSAKHIWLGKNENKISIT